MSITQNLQAVLGRISSIRPGAKLLAVSKTFGPEAVLEAYKAGQRQFGENYVQEGVAKIEALKASCPDIIWHFIGPLQSNKTRPVAEHFDWVQSIDRLKIAQRLSEQRPAGMPDLNVLLEINIDAAPTKSGIRPEEVREAVLAVGSLPRLKLRGFMAIPDPKPEEAAVRADFARLKAIFDEANRAGAKLDVLSMGMSADYPLALEEGATMVRVGSAIFGARHYPAGRQAR